MSLTLGLSALVGFQILISDKWLWSAAPSHAFGLIGFVAIDLLLSMAVLKTGAIAVLGAALASVTQFGAMLTDLVAGQPQGVPSIAFRAYLAGDTSYMILLIIQVALLGLAIGTITLPLWNKRVHFARILHHVRR